MFKRIALALMFVSAFSLASLVVPETADARRYWGRPYVSYYYGSPRASYYYRAPYRSYGGWYGPRYYQPYYYGYPRYYGYGYPGYRYYPRGGVAFSFGF
jgi:hypothetical protein